MRVPSYCCWAFIKALLHLPYSVVPALYAGFSILLQEVSVIYSTQCSIQCVVICYQILCAIKFTCCYAIPHLLYDVVITMECNNSRHFRQEISLLACAVLVF